MKLNFELCKICDAGFQSFTNIDLRFTFYCYYCEYFELLETTYNDKEFNNIIDIEDITKKEWKDIKKMEVVQISPYFNNCPYKLEHLVEN